MKIRNLIEEDIEELKEKMHDVMDAMAKSIQPNYGFGIADKYQGYCDVEIDIWLSKIKDNQT